MPHCTKYHLNIQQNTDEYVDHIIMQITDTNTYRKIKENCISQLAIQGEILELEWNHVMI